MVKKDTIYVEHMPKDFVIVTAELVIIGTGEKVRSEENERQFSQKGK